MKMVSHHVLLVEPLHHWSLEPVAIVDFSSNEKHTIPTPWQTQATPSLSALRTSPATMYL